MFYHVNLECYHQEIEDLMLFDDIWEAIGINTMKNGGNRGEEE